MTQPFLAVSPDASNEELDTLFCRGGSDKSVGRTALPNPQPASPKAAINLPNGVAETPRTGSAQRTPSIIKLKAKEVFALSHSNVHDMIEIDGLVS